MEKQLVIFGSSFNPPHWGHLNIVKKLLPVLKKMGLEKIILMPSAQPPLKSRDIAPIEDRLKMTKILARTDSRLSVSQIEIKQAEKGKKSYTINTINKLKKKYPGIRIYWIIGQDSLEEIIKRKWKGGLSILSQAHFIVVTRPGTSLEIKKLPEKILKKIKIIKINNPISSTMIRQMLRQGRSVAKLVPGDILNYIKKKHLYK